MNEDQEFRALYLDDLINYVIPVVDGSSLQLGSGVLVNVLGRHFVATAKHCIENDPRVMISTSRVQKTGTTEVRKLRIFRKGAHPTLDIGYLEIDDPKCSEIAWDQLCHETIVSGLVHIIGYPVVLRETDLPNRQMSLCAGVFSTSLIEETSDHLKFNYPKQGHKFDEASGTWTDSPFPEKPHGFSGGGCFGVVDSDVGGLMVRQYKLLAIQESWHKGERWVRAVRIKHWCDLLRADGHYR